MDLIKQTKENIKKYKLFRPKETLILGVSGGNDSVVLLDVLSKLTPLKLLVVAHLNHSLRGKDSDKDQEFVKNLAQKYSLKFETKTAKVANLSKAQKRNLEEVARNERYKFLAEIAKKYKTKKIVTAHQADDQVETVLLNYLRGTGPKGLSGMDFKSQITIDGNNFQILRPFLNIWRREIKDYQKKNNLAFREDKSNLNLEFRRNYLRIKIIPELEKQDKNFKTKIWQKSRQLKELMLSLDPEINKIYSEIKEKELPTAVSLNLFKFRLLGDNLKAEIFRKALFKIAGDLKDISQKHIMDFLETLKTGKIIVFPRQLRVLIDYDKVVLLKGSFKKFQPRTDCPLDEKIQKRELIVGRNRILESGLEIILTIAKFPDKKAFNFDFEKIKFPIFTRSVKPGDAFKMKNFKGFKKIQDLFVDLKIPQRLRYLFPIITDRNDQILGILGIRQGQEAEATKGTKRVLIIKFEGIKK